MAGDVSRGAEFDQVAPGHSSFEEGLAVAAEEVQQDRPHSGPVGDFPEHLAELKCVGPDHRNTMLVAGRGDEFGDGALVHRVLIVDDCWVALKDVAGCSSAGSGR
ncbi:hypothetical protein [Streptomyces sp. NBC_00448]|uniref:hypothetical protein n=1 Tax=Streptomyces sp. NBC_00448 TaxID=2903652 RepID=UPI002E2117FB